MFEAPAVVLYAGSAKVVQGDIQLLGFLPETGTRWHRAGATLINMEFVQFHPTSMVWPPSVKEFWS